MMILPLALALIGTNPAGDDPHPSRALLKPKPAELVNLAEGRRAILSLVPEGTNVKKGQVVGELDSAGLRDALANQRIALRQAEGEFQVAKTHRETVEKTYHLLPTGLAKQADKARNYVELGRAMTVEGDRRVWEVDEYEIFFAKAWAVNKKTIADETLKEAKVGLKTLETVTKPNRTREAEVIYSQAQSDELAKFSTLTLEQAKEKKLLLQIERCKLVAPADGVLVYANPPDGRVLIEEGAPSASARSSPAFCRNIDRIQETES